MVTGRFLLTPDGRPYFLQLRPGIQAWHGVTEEVLGVDLLDAQLRLAAGEYLGWEPSHFALDGHAMVVRIFADQVGGVVEKIVTPEGIRCDIGLQVGDVVSPGQDLGGIVIHAPTRQACIVRARAALETFTIEGVGHNGSCFHALFGDEDFWQGAVDRDRALRFFDMG